MPKGVYSKRTELQPVDRRTQSARFMRRAEALLFSQLPGGAEQATPHQRLLVKRCAALQLRLEPLDRKLIAGTLTDHDSRAYLAWSNGLLKALATLGLAKAPEPEPPVKVDPFAAIRALAARRQDEAA
jgi:hypothetical protein